MLASYQVIMSLVITALINIQTSVKRQVFCQQKAKPIKPKITTLQTKNYPNLLPC